MNNVINELTRSIVDKSSLHECSVNELQELTRQYPYFGPAQFLLARKLKEENSPLYEQQSQKAILFFQDHLWFDYLSGTNDVTATMTDVKPDLVSYQPAAAPVIAEEEKQEEKEIEPIVSENLITEKTDTEPELQPIAAATIEIPVAEPERVIDPISGQDLTEEDEKEEDEKEEVKQEQVREQEESGKQGEEQSEEEPKEEPEEEKAFSGPPIKFPEFKISPVDLSKPLTFEPFHTVDYFASQGIRVKDEEKPKDRFSQQLRSFTEWLKAIKKLPEPEVAIAQAPTTEDQRVTQMAEYSLKDRQVVTEAMADVWEKQENYEKAIDTYQKLSLLNPAKSSYFAAKIEQLKRR